MSSEIKLVAVCTADLNLRSCIERAPPRERSACNNYRTAVEYAKVEKFTSPPSLFPRYAGKKGGIGNMPERIF